MKTLTSVLLLLSLFASPCYSKTVIYFGDIDKQGNVTLMRPDGRLIFGDRDKQGNLTIFDFNRPNDDFNQYPAWKVPERERSMKPIRVRPFDDD